MSCRVRVIRRVSGDSMEMSMPNLVQVDFEGVAGSSFTPFGTWVSVWKREKLEVRQTGTPLQAMLSRCVHGGRGKVAEASPRNYPELKNFPRHSFQGTALSWCMHPGQQPSCKAPTVAKQASLTFQSSNRLRSDTYVEVSHKYIKLTMNIRPISTNIVSILVPLLG